MQNHIAAMRTSHTDRMPRSLALLAGLAAVLVFLIPTSLLHSQSIPISGRPVPSMTVFDDIMTDYLDDNNIEAGLLGIMRDGEIVYLRGFGWLETSPSVPMPENAMVRLASITKVVTGAAIRHLIDETPGLNLNNNAFNLGQTGAGALTVNPFDGVNDARLENVTINHLLQHLGGWDRGAAGVSDLTYEECVIASAYGVSSPPGRTRTMNWILSQNLQRNPGSAYRYSNIGYLAAGMIVEEWSGLDLLTYARRNILTQSMWIPWHEIRLGRTFRADRLPREPWYRGGNSANVFNNCNSSIARAYGGYHHEARIGQGGMVSSAATMLKLADNYHVMQGGTIGVNRNDTQITGNSAHGGSLSGVNTSLHQGTDGINIFVFINSNSLGSAADLRGLVRNQITNGGFDWPDTTSDGFWVVPCSSGCDNYYAGGGFDAPIRGIDNANLFLGHGSKVRLKPGSYTLTSGVLDTRMRIDAPLGTAVIGR